MFEFNPFVFLLLVIFTVVSFIGFLVVRHNRRAEQQMEQETKDILRRLRKVEIKVEESE